MTDTKEKKSILPDELGDDGELPLSHLFLLHEIRNVLTLILGNALMLEKENPFNEVNVSGNKSRANKISLNKTEENDANWVKGNPEEFSEKLANLIYNAQIAKDLLDIFDGKNSLEYGIEISFKSGEKKLFSLKKVVDSLFYAHKIADPQTKIELIQDISPDLFLWGNKSLFYQIFNNLLINSSSALQDAKNGLIGIKASKDNDNIRIDFWDNGVGMDEEQVKKVFLPRYTTKDFQGSGNVRGLGLSFVKKTVLFHHGDILCTSKKGEGTRFTIRLPSVEALKKSGISPIANRENKGEAKAQKSEGFQPLSIANRENKGEAKAQKSEGFQPLSIANRENKGEASEILNKKIAILEDSPDISEMIRFFLSQEGFLNIQTYDSSASLLEAYLEKGFDLVILDVDLPQMDGLEIGRKLRQNKGDLPLLFVTGKTDINTRHCINKTPKAHLITKPFEYCDIINAVKGFWLEGDPV